MARTSWRLQSFHRAVYGTLLCGVQEVASTFLDQDGQAVLENSGFPAIEGAAPASKWTVHLNHLLFFLRGGLTGLHL